MHLTFTIDTLILVPLRQSESFGDTNLDGVSIGLDRSSVPACYACLTYLGPDPRFDPRRWDNLFLKPTEVVMLPDSCLRGDIWTAPKLQKLRLLYWARGEELKYSYDALYEGIKNAILQQNPMALIVLA